MPDQQQARAGIHNNKNPYNQRRAAFKRDYFGRLLGDKISRLVASHDGDPALEE